MRLRTVTPLLPAETGASDGLAYTLWLPPAPQPPARAGVVVLHGADSCKESHHDFARAAVAVGLAAVCFDQRGHGESAGALGPGVLNDVARMAARLREALGDPEAPLAVRGSSMGGYLAILSAPRVRAGAVVAICPAGAEGLRRGLREGRFGFAAETEALDAFLDEHDLVQAARSLTMPLLILHAEGDERVPIAQSRELAEVLTVPESRLIAVPGGHHRSIQHDEELQAVSLRFIQRSLG
ncbi:MAG: alpha/beta hydrolase family protein [Solirubrobacteraceae bacterium]